MPLLLLFRLNWVVRSFNFILDPAIEPHVLAPQHYVESLIAALEFFHMFQTERLELTGGGLTGNTLRKAR